VLNIYFIAAHGENFRRLPENLSGPNVRISLICCNKSVLRFSKYFDEVIPVSVHPACQNFAQILVERPDLLSSLDGWVIFANDDDMFIIARSNLPDEIKMKVLPVRDVEGLRVLGSKEEFTKLTESIGISVPDSEIAHSPQELIHLSNKFSTPFLIKGDRGCGGGSVRVIKSLQELDDEGIPRDWYPIVIQEMLEDDLRGVDALYREGHLVGWVYRRREASSSTFEPPMKRIAVDPPILDFREDLKKFGGAIGAHGFANCSFMFIAKLNKHVLFEADLRPNAWHHTATALDVNWLELMTSQDKDLSVLESYPKGLPLKGIRVKIKLRELELAIQERRWAKLLGMMLNLKGEKSSLLYKDRPLNIIYGIRLISLVILELMKTGFKIVPPSMKNKFKTKGTTSKIASMIVRS
jgi:hypothetical protein